jgi:hypothetical protein
MNDDFGVAEQHNSGPTRQPATALTEIDRLRLLEAIDRHFDGEELRTLCFELEVDYDSLPARGKINKARELIKYCERSRRLDRLVDLCRQKRPFVDWPAFIHPSQDAASPFKGLDFYDVDDAHLFFGRERLTLELVGHLRRHRFLAVVGASGSGKSSLVRAGLIPALKGDSPAGYEGELPSGSSSWPVHILTPTAQPLKELATRLTLNAESVRATTQLIDDMAQEPRSLDIALSRLAGQLRAERILLVIDQFEELFTLCHDEAERQAFVDNLVTAVKPESTGPAVIVITLRADFYGHCLQYSSFHKLLEQQQKVVGPMTAVELRQVIEMPAKSHGLTLEPGLVALFLRDVGASGDRAPEPGALPLLSHALLETWRRRDGQRLTLAGYHAAGGVQGAIARTADTTYQRLSSEQQRIARNIFLRLAELSDDAQDTRRRASLAELIPQGEQAAAVLEVLKLLADARLVTTHQETAEVAHEVLIREWPTLRRWLDENRAALHLQRQLTEAAQTWEAHDRRDSYLYRGTRLRIAQEAAMNSATPLSSLEQTFLDESQQAQIRRRQRNLDWQQQTRRSALGAAAGGALGVGLAIWLAYPNLYVYPMVLLVTIIVHAPLGAVAGVLLILSVDLVLNKIMAKGEQPAWRLGTAAALAGMPGLAFLMASHAIIMAPSFTFSTILLATTQGSLWGAGAGFGRAWLQRSNRPLWQLFPKLAMAWSLLFLLANPFGEALSYPDRSASLIILAVVGAIVPLFILGGAILMTKAWVNKVKERLVQE